MVKPILYKSLLTTVWGQVAALWSDVGLWEMGFPRGGEDAAWADIRTKADQQLDDSHVAAMWANQLSQELESYLRGFRVNFEVPVDWRGYTAFQTEVLRFTALIPYGETVSYQQVAQAVGSPKAARAVGGAMHSNRTPLIIPCHRVVGANGSLTGFGGGIDMKKALLLLESQVNQ